MSNYSGVPTAAQVDYIRSLGVVGVIMGLQNSEANPFCADGQKAMFAPNFWQEFYVDLPGRRLDLCAPNSICWVDIEVNCFQDARLVREEVARLQAAGLRPGIYTNEGGMAALGYTTEFSYLPLWYSHPGMVGPFKPFCGWTEMLMFQYTSTTYMDGFGIDRNRRLAPAPVPPAPGPTKTHSINIYSDGSYKIT